MSADGFYSLITKFYEKTLAKDPILKHMHVSHNKKIAHYLKSQMKKIQFAICNQKCFAIYVFFTFNSY